MLLLQILQYPEAIFVGSLLIWRKLRRVIGLGYGAEVLPSGTTRLRIVAYLDIPTREPKPISEKGNG